MSIIEAAPQIATVLDEDVACEAASYLRKGVDIYTNATVEDISELEPTSSSSVGVRPESELPQAGPDSDAALSSRMRR